TTKVMARSVMMLGRIPMLPRYPTSPMKRNATIQTWYKSRAAAVTIAAKIPATYGQWGLTYERIRRRVGRCRSSCWAGETELADFPPASSGRSPQVAQRRQAPSTTNTKPMTKPQFERYGIRNCRYGEISATRRTNDGIAGITKLNQCCKSAATPRTAKARRTFPRRIVTFTGAAWFDGISSHQRIGEGVSGFF